MDLHNDTMFTLLDFLLEKVIIVDLVNQSTHVYYVSDVASSSGVFFVAFDFLVFLSLLQNELKKHVLVIEGQLLQGWSVLLRLFEYEFNDSEDLVMQNVVVLERLHKFYQNTEEITDISNEWVNKKLFE